MRWRRWRPGFIMPLAMGLMLVMVILTLGLIQQERAHTGFTLLNEFESTDGEGAELGFSTLQAILQGSTATPNTEIDPAVMGMSGGISAAGGGSQPFNQPPPPPLSPGVPQAQSVVLKGTFNGGPGQSLFRSLPPELLATNPVDSDGYADAQLGAFPVPTRHTLVVMDANVQNQPKIRYFSVYSGNFPFGLMAPDGTVAILDALSVTDLFAAPAGGPGPPPFILGRDFQVIGLPINIFAHDFSAAPGGFINGNVYLLGPTGGQQSFGQSTGPSGVGGGGISFAATPQPFPPSDFVQTLGVATTKIQAAVASMADFGAVEGLISQQLTLTALNSADPAHGAPLVLNPTNTRQTAAGVFNVGLSFEAPGLANVHVPNSLTVAGDVLVPHDCVLVVDGNLTVGHNLYLGARSTLTVGGVLTVAGTLDNTDVPAPNETSASSAIIVTGTTGQPALTLAGGMSFAPLGTPAFTPAGNLFNANTTASGGPIPPTISEPIGPPGVGCAPPTLVQVANPDFLAANAAATAANNALAAFIGAVNATPEDPTQSASNDPTGALLVADTGDIVLGGVKASGLVVAEQGRITVNAPARLVGAFWGNNGVSAASSHFRFFPYFTHAFVRFPGGIAQVGATRYYRTAYGRVQE